MTEVYYVEDDEQIAWSVEEYLTGKGFRVTVFGTVSEAKAGLRSHLPGLLLVDWNMPDGQGDRLCRWVRTFWQELPVIFLTVRGEARDVVCGFQNGADDYVVKPFELEVLYSRILALLRRAGMRENACLRCGSITLDREKVSVFCDREEIRLSQPEFKLLLLLMENKGKTVTRRQLLEQIWDRDGNYVNDNTLTVTMKRLREKLHHPSCLKTIRSFGYRLEEAL